MFDTCGNKTSSSYDFSQPLFRYNYHFVLVPVDLILSQNCRFHGREWHKVYKAADKKNIDDWIAMDAAAGQPCHDYQKTGPGIWYVSSLSVDPTMQGIGLGTQMIDYYENYIRERGGKQVVLFTNSQKRVH